MRLMELLQQSNTQIDGLGTVAGLVTAIATVLIGIGGILTALKVWIPTKRTARETKVQVQEVHKLVNQDRTDQRRFIQALVAELETHGIRVPIDQSTYDDPGTGGST